MQVGEVIKKHRKSNNMTQRELGEAISKTERTIQKYEKGDIEPPLSVLEELANIFNIPVIELLIESVAIEIHNTTVDMHNTVQELKAKINDKDFDKTYVKEMLEEVINNDISFIRLIYNRLFPNNRENIIDNISPSKASNIINSLKDTLEFELYKINKK